MFIGNKLIISFFHKYQCKKLTINFVFQAKFHYCAFFSLSFFMGIKHMIICLKKKSVRIHTFFFVMCVYVVLFGSVARNEFDVSIFHRIDYHN